MTTEVVRLLLADDEHLIRGRWPRCSGLRTICWWSRRRRPGPRRWRWRCAHRPDVAVLDLQMPGADGVKVATSLRAELPDCQVLIVTGHGRPGHLKRALAAGVRGSSRRR
ncbi:response regulator [Streptomyces sp. L7]